MAFNRVPINGQTEKVRNRNGVRYAYCPSCSKKGYYKVPRQYERCRCCGLHRILPPGQDF
jgi:hypothetical protein